MACFVQYELSLNSSPTIPKITHGKNLFADVKREKGGATCRKSSDHSRTFLMNSLYRELEHRGHSGFLCTKPDSTTTNSYNTVEGFPFTLLYELQCEVDLVAVLLFHPSELSAASDYISSNYQLLFLQGYPSPEWLNTLGAHFEVDPRFFSHHLGFLSINGQYQHTECRMLPSALKTILLLTVTSLGRQESQHDESLNTKRKEASSKMAQYLDDLRTGHNSKTRRPWQLGDSIVRSYDIYDHEKFALEQTISIHFA